MFIDRDSILSELNTIISYYHKKAEEESYSGELYYTTLNNAFDSVKKRIITGNWCELEMKILRERELKLDPEYETYKRLQEKFKNLD